MLFKDRTEAGKQLAEQLMYLKKEKPVIIALPRGGVPVGFEIAEALKAPLLILVVRKIGSPQQPEYGIGAIAEEGIQTIDWEMVRLLKIDESELREIIEKEEKELKRRVKKYKFHDDTIRIEEQTVILVDDGLATGVSARAAVFSLAKQKPGKIIFAVPVCAATTIRELKQYVEEVICIASPVEFMNVGGWYENFDEVTDQQVRRYVEENRKKRKRVNTTKRDDNPTFL